MLGFFVKWCNFKKIFKYGLHKKIDLCWIGSVNFRWFMWNCCGFTKLDTCVFGVSETVREEAEYLYLYIEIFRY